MENSLDKFTIDTVDEELITTFEDWLKESQPYHDELLPFQKMAYQYYIGNQTDKYDVPSYLSDTVENRIFETVETLVPIATANAHQFTVMPGSEDQKSQLRAASLQKVLQRKYETLEMQMKLEDVARHLMLYRFGVLKYFWNYDKDDIDVKVIDPRFILIPKLRTSPYNLPYVIELQGYSQDEIKDAFPDVDIDELTKETSKVDTGGKIQATEYQVFEVWTDRMVVWICSKKILDKKVNPNFDFKGKEKNIFKDKKLTKATKFSNHLDAPEKPYIFFTTFNVGESPLASIGLVDIGISLQDSINVQKRSIINNLKTMGNGQVLLDSDAMTEEEANNITNEPGLVIRGKNVASENKVRREAGVPLPNAHFSNLQHSEASFDNIMGTHAATRGNPKSDTLGQDIMSRQQDFTRLDMITRVLNRGVSRLANGFVQLIKMFYTEDHVIKILGEEGAVEFVRLNQDDVEDQIEIEVKSGVNLPMDEVALRTEAVQLWQLGALAPTTLYKRLKIPNPEKEAQALMAWKQGQLQMESQVAVNEAAQTGEIEAATAAKGAKTGNGRGTESFLDVLARAKESLGGKTEKPLKKASTKK